MPGFRKSARATTGWILWVGDPDDDQAHQIILAWLKTATVNFLNPNMPLSNRTKGNLGEFISYCIGRNYVFPQNAHAYTANSWDPLGKMSMPGIDIKWLNIGGTPVDDWITLQEVKTTGGNSLSIADDLIADYGKLFGQNLRLTLRTRLTHLKNQLDQQGLSTLSPRITQLGGPSPSQSTGVYLN